MGLGALLVALGLLLVSFFLLLGLFLGLLAGGFLAGSLHGVVAFFLLGGSLGLSLCTGLFLGLGASLGNAGLLGLDLGLLLGLVAGSLKLLHLLQVVGKGLEIGAEHLELGAAVDLVGGSLVGLRQGVDIGHREGVAQRELRVEAVYAFGHHLGPCLAVAGGLEPERVDAVGDEVVDNALGAAVAQLVVVGIGAHAVGVGAELDGDVGVVFEGLHQLVEGLLGGGTQRGLVEVVEDVFHHLGLVHGGEHKVDAILGILLGRIAGKLLAGVEIAAGAGQHHIAHAALQVEAEGAVGLHGLLLVAAVVAHDANGGIGHGLLVLVEHGARYPHLEVGFLKAVDVVVAAAVLAVAREEAALTLAKGDAEVVAAGVDGRAHVLDKPAPRGLHGGLEDVEAAEARMAVGGKVEDAVGAHVGEALVAGGVDLVAQVLEGAALVLDVDAPQVEAALAARHVAGEVEPHAVGTHAGVAVARQGVGRDFEGCGGAPLGLAALRGVDAHACGGVGLANGLGQVHGRAVGGERGDALVKLGVELALGRLGTLPLALVVFLGEENVAVLGAGDLALDRAGGFLVARGEVELVGVHIEKHGAVVGTPRVEELGALHDVAAALLAPLGCHAARPQPLLGLPVARHQLEIGLVVFLGSGPQALHVLGLGQVEQRGAVGVLIAQGILKRAHGAAALVELAVAQAHLEGGLAAHGAVFLFLVLVVELAIQPGRVVVLAAGIGVVAVAHLHTLARLQARGQACGRDDCNDYVV